MFIQWCLKGISERPTFGDTEAEALLYSGIKSNWLFNNGTMPVELAIPTVQSALGLSALLTHVNNYAAVRTTSPYISLSAGVVLADTALGSRKFPAWRSAMDFATEWGRSFGYVYRVWTIVTPQPAPQVLSVSDEVRNLNLFDAAWKYQSQGEITAKLVIPSAQIQYVIKVGSDRRPAGFRRDNTGFVNPETISNLLVEI